MTTPKNGVAYTFSKATTRTLQRSVLKASKRHGAPITPEQAIALIHDMEVLARNLVEDPDEPLLPGRVRQDARRLGAAFKRLRAEIAAAHPSVWEFLDSLAGDPRPHTDDHLEHRRTSIAMCDSYIEWAAMFAGSRTGVIGIPTKAHQAAKSLCNLFAWHGIAWSVTDDGLSAECIRALLDLAGVSVGSPGDPAPRVDYYLRRARDDGAGDARMWSEQAPPR